MVMLSGIIVEDPVTATLISAAIAFIAFVVSTALNVYKYYQVKLRRRTRQLAAEYSLK